MKWFDSIKTRNLFRFALVVVLLGMVSSLLVGGRFFVSRVTRAANLGVSVDIAAHLVNELRADLESEPAIGLALETLASRHVQNLPLHSSVSLFDSDGNLLENFGECAGSKDCKDNEEISSAIFEWKEKSYRLKISARDTLGQYFDSVIGNFVFLLFHLPALVLLTVGSLGIYLATRNSFFRDIEKAFGAINAFRRGDREITLSSHELGEMKILSRTFNRMAGEIRHQQLRNSDSERERSRIQLKCLHESQEAIRHLKEALNLSAEHAGGNLPSLIENISDSQLKLADDLNLLADLADPERCDDLQTHDLLAISREAFEEMRPVFKQSELAANFSSTLEHAGFHCSRGLMKRAVSNLLRNAVQHTRPGGSLTLSISENGQQFLIQVTDTGASLPFEGLPSVTEQKTLHRESEDETSMGFGVALEVVSAVAGVHGGKIESEGRKEHGRRFTLSLLQTRPISGQEGHIDAEHLQDVREGNQIRSIREVFGWASSIVWLMITFVYCFQTGTVVYAALAAVLAYLRVPRWHESANPKFRSGFQTFLSGAAACLLGALEPESGGAFAGLILSLLMVERLVEGRRLETIGVFLLTLVLLQAGVTWRLKEGEAVLGIALGLLLGVSCRLIGAKLRFERLSFRQAAALGIYFFATVALQFAGLHFLIGFVVGKFSGVEAIRIASSFADYSSKERSDTWPLAERLAFMDLYNPKHQYSVLRRETVKNLPEFSLQSDRPELQTENSLFASLNSDSSIVIANVAETSPPALLFVRTISERFRQIVLRNMEWNFWGLGLCFVPIGLLFSSLFCQFSKRHIEQRFLLLEKELQAYAKGDFRKKLRLEKSDEIGRIGASLNSLAGEIMRLRQQAAECRFQQSVELRRVAQQVYEFTTEIRELCATEFLICPRPTVQRLRIVCGIQEIVIEFLLRMPSGDSRPSKRNFLDFSLTEYLDEELELTRQYANLLGLSIESKIVPAQMIIRNEPDLIAKFVRLLFGIALTEAVSGEPIRIATIIDVETVVLQIGYRPRRVLLRAHYLDQRIFTETIKCLIESRGASFDWNRTDTQTEFLARIPLIRGRQ